METILDELAEIYFKSPKSEKTRLKALFQKAFHGTKKQISTKSQNSHLEFQVHLRTLLCFGYINCVIRKNHWKLFVPTDIKLLITIYYPDIFKAPIGMNLGCGINMFMEPIIIDYDSFDRMTTSYKDTTIGSDHFPAASGGGLLDMMDVNDCSVDVMNETSFASKVFDVTTNLFDKLNSSMKTVIQAFNFNEITETKTDDIPKESMQLVLSTKACLDDVFKDGLDKMSDLFYIKSNITGCNPYNVETSDITIVCNHGKDDIRNFFEKLHKRYDNVTMLSLNCDDYLVLITIPTKIVTINVFYSKL